MKTLSQMNRRAFIQAVAIGGLGFAVGCAPKDKTDTAAPVAPDVPATLNDMNAFVKVSSDNSVTVVVKHLEMGQGSSTGLPALVAEEMNADWSQMRWEHAPADTATYVNTLFGIQATGGSTGLANSFMQLRQMGAAAKDMLLQAAAEKWAVPIEELSVTKGVISHASGKSGAFGEFAEAAAVKTPAENLTLKSPEDFDLIGQPLHRLDSPSKVSGETIYTADIELPNMIHASIVHSPRFGGVVKSVADSAAKAMAGVIDVVRVPTGVAVAANSFYQAKKAAESLEIEWDFSGVDPRNSAELFADFRKLKNKKGAVAVNKGKVNQALNDAVHMVDAEFEFPFLAHATIEPMNAVVQIKDGGVELWTGSQGPTGDQMVLAQIAGVEPANVKINTLVAGGSFGRRANLVSDYVADAGMVALALGTDRPVKLQWTRENDMRAGRYRPMGVVKIKAGVDANGDISAWHQRNIVPSYALGTPWESLFVQNGVDGNIIEGIAENSYGVENYYLDIHMPSVTVPMSWWRSVGHSFNAFAKESIVYELAKASGQDPVELRRKMLKNNPRELGVLELAVAKAGPAPTGEGKARGVAVHASFGSHVAEIADVTLNSDSTYSVDKVVCAVDCGIAVNPDVIKAQMEGALVMGLGAAMREEITIENGGAEQENFYAYFPGRIVDAPDVVDVHIVKSAEPPTGVGEPSLPPIGPAVAVALQSAGAKPIRKLPFGDVLGV